MNSKTSNLTITIPFSFIKQLFFLSFFFSFPFLSLSFPLSKPFLSQEVPSTSSGSSMMLDEQNWPDEVSSTASDSSTVVDIQFRPEEVLSMSSSSSTVLDEQNRLEGVSSTAFGSSTGSGYIDESLGLSWVSDVSDLAAYELGVVLDSRSFFISDHVPFPVGATDDDSCNSAWVSADDDHAGTHRRTQGKRGKKGFFFFRVQQYRRFVQVFYFYFFIIIWAFQ